MEIFDLQGGVILNPMGLIDRNYYTLAHTNYIRCVAHGFRKEDFKRVFLIINLWKCMIPGAGPV